VTIGSIQEVSLTSTPADGGEGGVDSGDDDGDGGEGGVDSGDGDGDGIGGVEVGLWGAQMPEHVPSACARRPRRVSGPYSASTFVMARTVSTKGSNIMAVLIDLACFGFVSKILRPDVEDHGRRPHT